MLRGLLRGGWAAARRERGDDGEQFIHSMAAGVAAADRLAARVPPELRASSLVVLQSAELRRHLFAIRRAQEIVRAEQPLLVVPWRGNERNAAGQRLENADGGNAWQRRHIGPPRHVDCHAMAANSAGTSTFAIHPP